MTADEYLALLSERLAASYNVETHRRLGDVPCPLYACSSVVSGKYVLHRSMTYERIESNEHVICRTLPGPVMEEQVTSFIEELRALVGELVKPSHEHMSSALTGVLVAERGFAPEAARRVARSGFTRHFMLGLRGWCFLRLLGVDLSTGNVWANRRGKEVMGAYSPGKEGN